MVVVSLARVNRRLALILADRLGGSQCGVGQKGIAMANICVRRETPAPSFAG